MLNFDLVNIGELHSFATDVSGPLTPSQIATLRPVRQAYLQIREGRVAGIGAMNDYRKPSNADIPQQNLEGKTVLPGFVDPHTHLVFGGSREHELVARIAKQRDAQPSKGERMLSGINYTVQCTREASAEVLATEALHRLDRMLLHGTTTVEAKSGYGLRLEQEIKLLEVVQSLRHRHAIHLVSTFLGAHAVPQGVTMEDYVAQVLKMIPVIAERKLASFCDVFCETGFFSVEDSRQILKLASFHGLKLKVHADELDHSGGAALAAELGAISADHLQFASEADLQAMKAAGTIPVLLPGTAFYLGLPYANAKLMHDLDMPMAISTDLNPGGCYCESQSMMAVLAVTQMHLLPVEAFVGITRNAAYAIDRGAEAGILAPGRSADFVVVDAPNLDYVPYHFGVNLVEDVYIGGQKRVSKGVLETVF
jgi:imidazolonepropionase